MLKLHDFTCPVCHHTKEELLDVPPALASIHCAKCGTLMEHCVVGGRGFTFKPFWHPHIDHRPVYIDSWRTLKNELRSRNLRSEFD